MPTLFVYPRSGEALDLPLGIEKISIGRSMDSEIVIPEQFCSSHHALIYPSEGRYILRDNKSKNGTFVNGNRIQGEVELKRGDEILIGLTRIIFDKELLTSVEVVETKTPEQNINTIINVKEILKKPVIDTTLNVPGIPTITERLKIENKALSVLGEVSQALIYHLPLDQLLEHIMDLISENLPMDRGFLMLKEGNPEQLIPKVIRINNKSLQNQNIQVSQSIVQTALDKNSAVLVSDVQSDSLFRAQASVVQFNIHSAMCVPLWNNKEIIGIVYADRISLLEPFSEVELKLLTLLSNLAAVKIENAKLFEQAIEKIKMEKELVLATQIQKNFLPKENPECKNYDIAGANITCYQVGGDYYDFIPIDSDRLGIVIADVSGKGVSASLLMASLRAALHSEIHPRYKIEELAPKLNDFLHRSSDIDRFITFFFCDLDKKSGDLTYINAGHNPPIVLDHKGKVQRLESCGLCLGMFAASDYEIRKLKLHAGDLVLLFTDGITEARNKDNEDFQEDRLIEIIKKQANLPAKKLVQKILDEVRSFTSGADPADDITLVIIKRME